MAIPFSPKFFSNLLTPGPLSRYPSEWLKML
ncbi:hypothetical protein MPLDJ20_340011 [Mesorhizobium plurifarium]|uniref:Uncharacterized protein n=1 Tax=Mesorhizobium plurifarium TaxID=69974 RepID=A0A090FIM4_MESPL|nr:hypothetical protein MPLDJ20_340011 [Mesorhizobium plurifarium]